MTDRLYYTDPYNREFDATVLSVEAAGGRGRVQLDRTCFYPTSGGQPHDIGTLVDEDGIAIRTGHHCTQPVMKHFGIPATARASLSMYNTRAEIDKLVESLKRVKKIFN